MNTFVEDHTIDLNDDTHLYDHTYLNDNIELEYVDSFEKCVNIIDDVHVDNKGKTLVRLN